MGKTERELLRHLLIMLSAAVILALFGAIYERFSHEVYSYFMLYAFALPLALGALPYAVLLGKGRAIQILTLNLWDGGILTLAVGSVMRGVLDIYGTTNRLMAGYPIAAAVLAVAACAAGLMSQPHPIALPKGRR